MEGEQAVKPKGKSNLYIAIIAVLLCLILIMLFLISPLKNLIFPVAEIPQLTLVVVESAASAEDPGTYRILVEAIVEGNPEPQVQFNRNEGIGQVEPNFSLVLLAEEETFLLTAVATNAEGSAEAALELFPGIAVGVDADSPDAEGGPGATDPDADDDEGEDTEDDPEAGPADPDGNNAPEIEAIIYEDDDISDLIFRGESLPVRYAEGRHNFVVIATDRDDDAVEFDIEASHGSLVDITRVAVDSVAFTWLSPANPAGNLEALNVSIAVTASDPAGAADRQVIAVALLPVVGDDGADDPVAAEVTLNTVAVADLSGYVTSAGQVRTGVVLIGDNSSNESIKGYLAFSLATLREVHPDSIISTRIRFDHINKSGRPETFATWVDFKEYDYGPDLDARDFAVGGTRFYKQRAESFNSGLSVQGSLITQVRRAVAAGDDHFFVKMGLDVATNNNSADDLFQFLPGNVVLQVVLLER
ncbi:MAG: hypothetical protein FJ152_09380 [Firmicutes bacterium]|nr:hypothetical protein [Bacillota bacterium]